MKLKKLTRAIDTKDLKLDVEKRTLSMPFSSETPVERYFGFEVLSHDPGCMDMSRAELGAMPLLYNHNMDALRGVVEGISMGSDRRGQCEVRFANTPAGDECMALVQDKILRNVSFGYMINEMMVSDPGGANRAPTYLATKWTPYEISMVTVPADPTVGVGRAIDEEYEVRVIENPNLQKLPTATKPLKGEKTMSDPVVTPAAPAIDQSKIQAEAVASERARTKEITALGAKFNKEELARQLVEGGKSIEESKHAFLESLGQRHVPVHTGRDSDLGLSEKEVKNFSFLRAINALANPHDKDSQEAAGFEREVSKAAQMKNPARRAINGFSIPAEILRAGSKRDLTVGTTTAGGHTVATELMAASFIDLLRNHMALDRLGVTQLNGLQGNIAIPRQTGGATAYWVAESGNVTESAQAFDQVTGSPKSLGAFSDISRLLLMQSSVDVENLVKGDIAKVLALEIDRVGLYGLGSSNQPTGLNASSPGTVNFAASIPTFAEIVAMETAVGTANADFGSLAYITNALGRGSLKSKTKTSPSTEMIWEKDNTMNGYPALVSNQVVTTSSTDPDYWFGNWADLILGFWGGLDLLVDPYTGGIAGTVRVIAMQSMDVMVRHAASFCKGANNP